MKIHLNKYLIIKLKHQQINTINKEKNQIIVENIEKNKYELFKTDKYDGWVIKPIDKCIKLKDDIDLILDFN